MRQALVRPARINRWVVVVFDHRASTDRVKAFVGHLKENMRKLGMSVNSEPLFSLGGPNVAEVWLFWLLSNPTLRSAY